MDEINCICASQETGDRRGENRDIGDCGTDASFLNAFIRARRASSSNSLYA
ncbi:hypothetical protein DPMN_155645 [Dreissena polymorpha]|uniref:Uncharacterized protein n=1 Tax=Dreissena polymorpha TaxID=45954 RepID=A0A9D4J818_DREPO|nr:hypothetical protein DPMN_155615 [Dreissena polymorpha]KAH3801980.1 hypothetical protein DPMN_155645 [Dreissena polymorpha]